MEVQLLKNFQQLVLNSKETIVQLNKPPEMIRWIWGQVSPFKYGIAESV